MSPAAQHDEVPMTAIAPGATLQLARHTASLRFEDLPVPVVETAKRAVRDVVGVALLPGHLAASRIEVATFAREVGGPGDCTIWASGDTTTAPFAALANASAAFGLEMDDRSHNLDIHNGAPTVPSVVALAEATGASGRDVLLGVVCGYEVAFRVARATYRAMDRFFWVSVRSLFGATAGAAKVLGLDAEATASALGLAGSMASGLWQFTHDPSAVLSKRILGGGWPAHSGVLAALMAQRGFDGPHDILEGEHGVCRSFSTAAEPTLEALTDGLGTSHEMLLWEPKLYATRGQLSPAVEAVEQLRDEVVARGLDEVERIVVGCSERVIRQTGVFGGAIGSLTSAQHNIAFVVAAAFLVDFRDPDTWREELLAHEGILGLLARTTVVVDAEIDAIDVGGETAGTRVTVTFTDAPELHAWVRYDKGRPENPVPEADLLEKFLRLAQRGTSPEVASALAEHLGRLEHEDVVDLALLRGRSWTAASSDQGGS